MRAFIAIDFDSQIKKQLDDLQRRLRDGPVRLRWTDPAQIHLTVKFLGEVAAEQVAPIQAALNDVARGTAPFEVQVGKVGTFPPGGRPRVVWVGVTPVGDGLMRCRDAVEAAVSPLGFPTEGRAFEPHLTLARCPDPRAGREVFAALSPLRTFDGGVQRVDRLVLYESTLTPYGPRYHRMSEHLLTVNCGHSNEG